MKRILLSLFALLSLTAFAQDDFVRRGNCLSVGEADSVIGARAETPRRLPVINRDWNPNRVYRQAVILITFSDKDFVSENPQDTYNRIFNERGYNERAGVGCVADYFRDQSGGLFNMQFDVYGPYQVSTKAQPYDNPTESTHNYGKSVLQEATNLWIAANPTLDYSQYSWNGNGKINQVVYVCAGYSGNQSSEKCYGYVWPNTSTFSTVMAPDGTTISDYTVSCELWSNDTSCGIGTICHEFTHSLGLPDIYPTNNNGYYSALDEWDLMDGGNFTNFGWCPPNWSPMEKMLLGWLTPTELTEPATIKDLKPVADGGQVYQIKHTATEYLLLENRQWRGWDAGLPGKGLVAYHVNYVESKWRGNTVNNTAGQFCFDLVHADQLDYNDWNNLMIDRGLRSQYLESGRMHNLHLSTSPYPWSTDSTAVTNNKLTDTSVPAAKMYTTNAAGSNLLGKPLTNITMSADGLVSFDFMGGEGTVGIVSAMPSQSAAQVYDLQGRRVSASHNIHEIVIVRQADGTVRKVHRHPQR